MSLARTAQKTNSSVPSSSTMAALPHQTQNQEGQLDDDDSWKPELFPFKMYDVLEDAEREGFHDIVSWLPGGTAFKIHSRAAFENIVMPRYFPNMNSYKSFRRQLNLYGIYQDRTLQNCADNAYSHELFVRGHRYLCDFMERRRACFRQAASKERNSKREGTKFSKVKSESQATDLNLRERQPDKGLKQLLSSFDLDVHSSQKPLAVPSTSLENKNIYDSFINQKWIDLPEDVTPAEIVDDIISLFKDA
mmetsp:Transcript_8212/g.14456  ORF Transcript_8212/g.14456 Transcript_8212/m.14456 type:complete len:249 (-) Transcript_8212:177-923(-)